MNAVKCLLLSAACFTCVSSNEGLNDSVCGGRGCETHRIHVRLGSSVLLPCILRNSSQNSVSWSSTSDEVDVRYNDLVELSPSGRVNFLIHKHGRMKVFPMQNSQGNFSVRIDEVEDSDFGCYRCEQDDHCHQIKVAAADDEGMWLLIYISIAVAVFILLNVCSYLLYINIKQDGVTYPVAENTEGAAASAPPVEVIMVSVQEQHRGMNHNHLVYENDDQDPDYLQADPPSAGRSLPGFHQQDVAQGSSGIYPNLNQFNFERAQSQRTKQRFHRDLFNRLRQASTRHHFYVNQSEINRQQAASAQAENRPRGGGRKKKTKESQVYKNPIYNRSTDQLNHL